MALLHGFNDTDPPMEHTDDRNDDDDVDRRGAFQPGDPVGTSTPSHGKQIPIRTTTMNRPEMPFWFPQVPDDSTFTAVISICYETVMS